MPAGRVFGALLTPPAAAALIAATVLLGLPGLALATLAWLFWKLGGPPDPPPRAAGDIAFGGQLPPNALRQYQAAAAAATGPTPTAEEVRAATRAAWAARQEKKAE